MQFYCQAAHELDKSGATICDLFHNLFTSKPVFGAWIQVLDGNRLFLFDYYIIYDEINDNQNVIISIRPFLYFHDRPDIAVS
jgi:hypothetical protein